MKNYNLKGIDGYFDENWGFDFRDLVMDTFLYDPRYTLNCHEENFEKDIYENCDTREEAEKWAIRYVKISGLVYDKATLLQALKDELYSEIRYLEKMEKRLNNE
jgi:hypothetical protein